MKIPHELEVKHWLNAYCYLREVPMKSTMYIVRFRIINSIGTFYEDVPLDANSLSEAESEIFRVVRKEQISNYDSQIKFIKIFVYHPTFSDGGVIKTKHYNLSDGDTLYNWQS